MKFALFMIATLGYPGFDGLAVAQTSDDPTVAACKSTGVLAPQAQAADVTDLVLT
jgi:hypothetical protein